MTGGGGVDFDGLIVSLVRAVAGTEFDTTELRETAFAARASIAELIAAATEVRDVTWGPGKTDQPHIIRLDSALAALESQS